jgi:bacterioferritin
VWAGSHRSSPTTSSRFGSAKWQPKIETGSEGDDVNEFELDLDHIRTAARQHIEAGPVTDAYGEDVARVIAVLNEVLATELVCVLRYKSHYYMAKGVHGHAVAAEFLEHAADEQSHADLAAERVAQLGGEPDLNPAVLAERSHTQYVPGGDLQDMIREDLVAERIAIATYAEIARWLGDADPTTRRLMEHLLAEEEGHAEDLRNLLDRIDA